MNEGQLEKAFAQDWGYPKPTKGNTLARRARRIGLLSALKRGRPEIRSFKDSVPAIRTSLKKSVRVSDIPILFLYSGRVKIDKRRPISDRNEHNYYYRFSEIPRQTTRNTRRLRRFGTDSFASDTIALACAACSRISNQLKTQFATHETQFAAAQIKKMKRATCPAEDRGERCSDIRIPTADWPSSFRPAGCLCHPKTKLRPC